ncbi:MULTISPECIES: Ig domain-containing protein [Methylomonas]|uniref:Ig domain-containing protein n=1 Tax=Methylomonas TaxID=416 RepID=UPI001680F965|nr:Ig domain-containing protein [Methylomonas rhizoryzae]
MNINPGRITTTRLAPLGLALCSQLANAAPSLLHSLQLGLQTDTPVYDAASRTYRQNATLKNLSDSAIAAPISWVLKNTSPPATSLAVTEADGQTIDGYPYRVVMEQGQLAAGQQIEVSVSFAATHPFSPAATQTLTLLAGKVFKKQYTPSDPSHFSVSYDLVRLPAGNQRPIAVAKAVWENGIVSLNGNLSSDANSGQTLSYRWSLSAIPTGSAAAIEQTDAAQTRFTPDLTGDYGISLQVNDGYEDSLIDTITLTVSETGGSVSNRAPTITSTANTSATGTRAYSYAVQANDPDGDALTFSLTTAPSGMSINAETGLIGWTPMQPHHDGATSRVVLKVSDGKGGNASQSFDIAVKICTCL